MIRFESVSMSYGGVSLFKDLSFTLRPHRKAVLTGPSGSGKTSALELVPGFRRPSAGKVFAGERPVAPAHRARIRAGLGYLPQESPLHGTVREAIYELFQLKANVASRPSENKTRELLERLRLPGDILDRESRELSGGERRRVGLAAVWLLERPLLLLDEVTAGLDPEAVRAVHDLVFTSDRTILSISHDPAWQERCDQRIPIRDAGNGRANQ